MNKPTFLIIGAARCGTASLHYYLGQHPDVCMSKPKEPKFFSLQFEKGMEFYWNKYFSAWKGQKAAGEASPENLLLPFVSVRIKETLPEAKLIAILRSPVDRAYSMWWMHYTRRREKLSFEQAISQNLESIEAGGTFEGEDGPELWRQAAYWRDQGIVKHRMYLDAGYYAQHLNRYLRLFPESQIKVVFYDDLCRDPEAVVRELLDFIDLYPTVNLKDPRPQNVAVPKVFMPLWWMAYATGATKIVPLAVRARLENFLCRLGRKPRMKESTRRWLVDHYYQHNRDLERMVGRDLSHWDK